VGWCSLCKWTTVMPRPDFQRGAALRWWKVANDTKGLVGRWQGFEGALTYVGRKRSKGRAPMGSCRSRGEKKNGGSRAWLDACLRKRDRGSRWAQPPGARGTGAPSERWQQAVDEMCARCSCGKKNRGGP
jgi:hypothetical protein